MNEPSNFVEGSIHGCPDNTLENPPFIPPGFVCFILNPVNPKHDKLVISHTNYPLSVLKSCFLIGNDALIT